MTWPNVPAKRPVDHIFKGRREAILGKKCVFCGKAADKFDDLLSVKEFEISGMCQTCQNDMFA